MSCFENALKNNEQQEEEVLNVLRSIIWRKHTLSFAVKTALNIEGDFVECGVNYGFGIDLLAHYLDFEIIKKDWYLYDTFEGVPLEQRDEGFIPDNSISLNQFEQVKLKFSKYENIKVIKGMLPDILNQNSPKKISFLHIDLNNAKAEIETLLNLLPIVSMGGVIVLDDYGAMLFKRQCDTEKHLLDMLGISLLELPTGQGLFIKNKNIDTINISVDDILKKEYLNEIKSYPQIKKDNKITQTYLADLISAYDYYLKQIKYIKNNIQNEFEQKFYMEVKKEDILINDLEKYSIDNFSIMLIRNKIQAYIDYCQNLIDQSLNI